MSSENSKAESQMTDEANQILIGLEEQALALVEEGKKEDAFKVLLGQEYLKNKAIYSKGIEATIEQVNTQIDDELQSYSQRLLWAVTFTAISCLFLMVGWSFILYVVRLDIRQRQKAEIELKNSEKSLQYSNQELEKIQTDLATQAQSTQAENAILEEEVSHLLDIVSDLESGDFTCEAQVSDRVTGLVADMLNQFIQEMGQVIATVNETCLQVKFSNLDVETLANTTLNLAQKQVGSVEQIQSLMESLNVLSEDSLTQARVSDMTLQNALQEVEKGASEMTAMTSGFESLRDGTDQITRRVESLNSFVDMAAQFAQSQKRVASLTRVLAYNASMVASRAEEQQDPNQFASVAREFAAIATQVNDLAVQTNQSLETLEQRTQQIQSAVSGITDDTQDINELLSQFTLSVDKSSRSFNNLKSATEQMAQLSQQVTRSSEEIAQVANNTTVAMELIREGGDQTETQSRLTQEQSSLMGQLTEQLLERMDFFKLKTSESSEPQSTIEVDAVESSSEPVLESSLDSPEPALAHSAS